MLKATLSVLNTSVWSGSSLVRIPVRFLIRMPQQLLLRALSAHELTHFALWDQSNQNRPNCYLYLEVKVLYIYRGVQYWVLHVGPTKVKARKSFLFYSPKSSRVLKIKNIWLILLSHCKHERFPVKSHHLLTNIN